MPENDKTVAPPKPQLTLAICSALLGGVLFVAPVSVVEMILVMATNFQYEPFVSAPALVVGAVMGLAARQYVFWNRRKTL